MVKFAATAGATGVRTLSLQVTDGTLLSNVVTRAVNVT